MDADTPERVTHFADGETGEPRTFHEIGKRSLVFLQREDHTGNITRIYGSFGRPLNPNAELSEPLKTKQAEDLARIAEWKKSRFGSRGEI